MKKLNKHDILGFDDRKIVEIDVPEWGGSVFIKTINVSEGIAYQNAKKELHDDETIALYLTYALCDESGNPLFTANDLAELNTKNPSVLIRLFYAALAHNKMDLDGDEEREKKC